MDKQELDLTNVQYVGLPVNRLLPIQVAASTSFPVYEPRPLTRTLQAVNIIEQQLSMHAPGSDTTAVQELTEHASKVSAS